MECIDIIQNKFECEAFCNNSIPRFTIKNNIDINDIISFSKIDLGFDFLSSIFGVHFPEEDLIEINYIIRNLDKDAIINIKAKVKINDDISSISSIFESAIWYEREIYDMFGVKFSNLPDTRRILTDYNFEGHPLRKDFPLSGHYEVVFDPNASEVVRQDVNLFQDYRNFDLTMPFDAAEIYKNINSTTKS